MIAYLHFDGQGIFERRLEIAAGRVGIRAADDDQPTAEVRIEVHDSGIGIPPAQRSLIFEAFHQVSEKIHLDYGGLGIGLALVRSLVELQGGAVALESTPDEGSRFTFSLPARDNS